jgi:xanthine dehydrogenase accessory factor
VEPYLPKSLLVLVGHGPIVEALAALGRAADHTVVVVGEDALGPELRRLELTAWASVVVATHGEADEEALATVLGTDVGYVSLVASRRRAAVIMESLKQRGLPLERLDRLKAPAGLDIGAVTPEEVAVSILAEIIHHHRSKKPPPAPVVVEARDPVCGMLVDVATAEHRSEVTGQPVYFCCRHCQEVFEADPTRYRTSISG